MQDEVISKYKSLAAKVERLRNDQRQVKAVSQVELRQWILELNKRRAERGEALKSNEVDDFIRREWRRHLADRRRSARFCAPDVTEPAGRIAFTHDVKLAEEFSQLLLDAKTLFNDEVGLETGGRYTARLAIKLAVLLLNRIPTTAEIAAIVEPLTMLEAALARLDQGEMHAVLEQAPKPPNRSTPAIQTRFRIGCCLAAMALEQAGKSRPEALQIVFQAAQHAGSKFTESSIHKKFSPKTLDRWVRDFRKQVRLIPANYSDDELTPEQSAYEFSNFESVDDRPALLKHAEMLLSSLTISSLRKGTL